LLNKLFPVEFHDSRRQTKKNYQRQPHHNEEQQKLVKQNRNKGHYKEKTGATCPVVGWLISSLSLHDKENRHRKEHGKS